VIVIDEGEPKPKFKPFGALSVTANASAFSTYESEIIGIEIIFEVSFAAKFSVPKVAM